MSAVDQSIAVNDFFENRVKAPSPFLMMLESRALLELGSFFQAIPILKNAPKGDGHPVIVIPGFMTSDSSTAPLRWFLNDRGYQAHPWGLGTNTRFDSEVSEQVRERILKIHEDTGRKVSIVGWSLGGVYARDAGLQHQDIVRQVITLGTPFSRSMAASPVVKIYESLNRKPLHSIDPELIARLTSPMPIPFTSIYSKLDGVVSWQCSVSENAGDQAEHIEVNGSHCGLGHNPTVLMTVAERLAQKEGDWKPFEETSKTAIHQTLQKQPNTNTEEPVSLSEAREGRLDRLRAIIAEVRRNSANSQ